MDFARSDFRRAFSYIAPYRSALALVVAVSLGGTALSLYLPYLTRDLIDRALLGRDSASLVRIVLLFAILTAASFAANVWSGLRYTRVSAQVLFDMRLDLYRHLQALSPRFYARTRLGDVVSRLNNDIAEIQRVAAEVALAWAGNVLFLAGSIAMMFWLDARLALLTLALVPLSLWALGRYRRRLEGRVRVMRDRSADIGSFLVETLQGSRLVVGANAQVREVARFRAKNDAFIDALMATQRLTYLAGGLPGLIMSAGGALVFLVGGWQVVRGALTLGTFVAFLAYQMRLFAPLQALMGLYAAVASARASLARVDELFACQPEVREEANARPLPTARGDVALEGVTFSFDRGAPVLQDVSFTAARGESVAVVGPSGGGKSTLGDLLARLIDPDAGTVRLDGHDLRTLRLEDVRRHVAIVDQQPFVFHATLADNVRYARPAATGEELGAALRAAGLDAFVATLPQGLDTVVGERGLALSVGERQRLALARAFLADPAVLVLDEPTSALDPALERRIVEASAALLRGRTAIVITHRLQLAMLADRVVVLDGARVVEEGRSGDLLARGGAFARLFDGTLARVERT